ncbi:hypothetical protein [Streptomyces sp. NPDC005438]|uniref:hypothetical protein n=1 Tax=Streptomyces sp. NPDC005438 TaxID=3156880 RepID=UPI0033B57F61
MEVLLLLIVLTAFAGVLLVPALRRRQAVKELHTSLSGAEGVHGLVPTEDLDLRLPGPDPELVEALGETQRTQDWRPVAQLLALTDHEGELRWQRVQSIAGAAALELSRSRQEADPAEGKTLSRPDARWLRQWRGERPDDAGGAEVYAQFLVWQALGQPDSADHRIVLEEARNVAHQARELSPHSVVPLVVELFVARGLGYSAEEFDALWARVTALAPHHMGAHLAALPYHSRDPQGTRERAYAFAERAAASGTEGSLLSALPLFAVYDHLPDVQLVRGFYQSAVVQQAIHGAQFAVQNARHGNPVVPHVRHLLLWFLVRAEQYPEALEQLHAVDGYIGAVPWVDESDPVAAYVAYRSLALAGREAV